ncbi:MAG: hypothetical protein K2L87_07040, partial [Clostridiales bacterium]|nr:hypothetical protein [Clostridiales bacterium]
YCVLNHDDDTVRGFAEKTKAKPVYFSVRERVDGAYIQDGSLCYRGERVLSASELPVSGEHNLANALAAIAASKLMGVETSTIASALKSFRGVSHRIQLLGEVNGIKFIDDSKATNVDSAIKAVESVKGETVLLLGGKDKGYSYEPLFDAVKDSGVVHCVLYGENAFKILNAALKRGYTAVTLCRPFDMAVRVAYLTARRGQNVLLSPASASFDAFKSYEERGDRFAALMETMKCEALKDAAEEPTEELSAEEISEEDDDAE